jgi:hypothetical protein
VLQDHPGQNRDRRIGPGKDWIGFGPKVSIQNI